MEKPKKDPVDEEIEERRAPSSRIIHDTIVREGEEELERSPQALAWSGVAAGFSMGASTIAEAALHARLGEGTWTMLVSKFGYCVGFLVVILGRQQLFTENTLTPILPLLDKNSSATFWKVARLWGIVLLTNLIGAAVVALFLTKAPVLEESIRVELLKLGEITVRPDFITIACRGVLAGWLIALLVWLLPFAEAGRVWIIIILTYVIGIAGFSHVIAGSIEVFALAWAERLSWVQAFIGFIIPALIGNIIGGVALVASINHAQVVPDK
ncbi:MAG TPA: formate/nitrite transporter family protein [Opitutaceae bacterium]|nr:formate/nitrite transporter family protein [Opitutaceae bacterium]